MTRAVRAKHRSEVVQTFRSARPGRPEGLHDGGLSRHEACPMTISSRALYRPTRWLGVTRPSDQRAPTRRRRRSGRGRIISSRPTLFSGRICHQLSSRFARAHPGRSRTIRLHWRGEAQWRSRRSDSASAGVRAPPRRSASAPASGRRTATATRLETAACKSIRRRWEPPDHQVMDREGALPLKSRASRCCRRSCPGARPACRAATASGSTSACAPGTTRWRSPFSCPDAPPATRIGSGS